MKGHACMAEIEVSDVKKVPVADNVGPHESEKTRIPTERLAILAQ